jgi:hypothetical protein
MEVRRRKTSSCRSRSPKLSGESRSISTTVTPIALATAAEALRSLQSQDPSLAQLQSIVAKAAASFGAGPGLTACLMKHLPSFCKSLLACNADCDGLVSGNNGQQYEIWTGGEHRVVASLEGYRKEQYLLWIDRDRRKQGSAKSTRRIGDIAINLLICLAASLGKRVAPERILEVVWGESVNGDELTEDRKSKIEMQLTALHEFSGRRFRSYLYPERFTKGLGLKASFSDKYFVFCRIS